MKKLLVLGDSLTLMILLISENSPRSILSHMLTMLTNLCWLYHHLMADLIKRRLKWINIWNIMMELDHNILPSIQQTA